MDVVVNGVGSLRSGKIVISSTTRKREITFPGCILSTNAGCVPHLTGETYDYIPKLLHPMGIKVPLCSVIDHEAVFSAYPGAPSEFLCLQPEELMILTVQDTLPPTRGKTHPQQNTAKAISVWGNHGRILVDPEKYIKFVTVFKPHLFEILADGNTDSESVSKKRVAKSHSNSIKYLDEALSTLKNSKGLEDSYAIAPLEGGNVTKLRKEHTAEVLKKLKEEEFLSKTAGFLVDGISFDTETEEPYKLVEASVEGLPEKTLRFIHGPQSPERIFKLIESGIDIFDTSYPINLAQKHTAIIFKIPGLPTGTSRDPEVLDLTNEEHKAAFEPLLKGCTCYACQNHTRAYIYHLVSVKELLAPILLTLHNLQHYFQFFEALRVAIDNGQYSAFKWEALNKTEFF